VIISLSLSALDKLNVLKLEREIPRIENSKEKSINRRHSLLATYRLNVEMWNEKRMWRFTCTLLSPSKLIPTPSKTRGKNPTLLSPSPNIGFTRLMPPIPPPRFPVNSFRYILFISEKIAWNWQFISEGSVPSLLSSGFQFGRGMKRLTVILVSLVWGAFRRGILPLTFAVVHSSVGFGKGRID